MLRIIIGFAAGLLTAKLVNSPERLDDVKSVAKENMEKIKNASGKIADTLKDEFKKKHQPTNTDTPTDTEDNN